MKIYCSYHPQSVLDGGFQFERRIEEDLERFKHGLVKAPSVAFPRSHASAIGFDTEYAPDARLLTVGLSDGTRAQALETTVTDWLQQTKKIVKAAKVLCGHSVDGDLDYLVKYRLAKEEWLRGKNVLDSFLLARMADENRGKGGYGLQPLLLSYFNFKDWKADTEKILKKTQDASQWSVEQRTKRCRIDAWATVVLATRLQSEVSPQLYEFTSRISSTLHRVGLAGAGVNLGRFHRLGTEWHSQGEKLRAKLIRYAHRHGVTEFAPTNDNHVRELLYEKLKLPVLG
jgi:DNA polymerase I-like protein with 3'-5' exonuclease and polymerase domains